jgi:hypothetical protein
MLSGDLPKGETIGLAYKHRGDISANKNTRKK